MKRTPVNQKAKITPEMLDAWRAVKRHKKRDTDEYHGAFVRLQHAIGLTKFDVSPCDVGKQPPAYWTEELGRESLLLEWYTAKAWRAALEAADREAVAAK
jgi:hypothetical protein